MFIPNIYLDSTFKPSVAKATLFVIDCRVAVFKLLKLAELQKPQNLPYLVQHYFSSLPWLIYPNWKVNPQIVVVDDSRTRLDCGTYNYWRDQWLQENHGNKFPTYKGCRNVTSEEDRPDHYMAVYDAILHYCAQTNVPVFRQKGFEADDWMGVIYRYAKQNPSYVENYQTIICSVDNDLAQLVSEELDILMYVTGSFKCPISRLRSEYEVLKYYELQHGWQLKSPYSIVDFKSKYGDDGDSIIAGSPREIIDLRQPPVTPKLRRFNAAFDKHTNKSISRELNKNAALDALNFITLH